MWSAHEEELNIEALPAVARHAHILPGLANHSLLFVGQLCDAGCKFLFRVDTVLLFVVDKKCIMVGRRITSNGLWMVDLTDIKKDNGFNNNIIFDFACSLVGEERPQMTIKGTEASTVAEHMAFFTRVCSSQNHRH